ncbi:MAG: hypothetical protein ACE5QF_07760 [Thermoplasmata archaeon]
MPRPACREALTICLVSEGLYDEHGRMKTERELSAPAPRRFGRWMAIAAGILILIPSVLVLIAGISYLAFGVSNITGFGFFAFVLSWWILFFGFGGLVGGICAITRSRGLLAVVGAVLMMFVIPYFAAPALLLLYVARDEFW